MFHSHCCSKCLGEITHRALTKPTSSIGRGFRPEFGDPRSILANILSRKQMNTERVYNTYACDADTPPKRTREIWLCIYGNVDDAYAVATKLL